MQSSLSPSLRLLAFDTSTDRLSIALTDGARVWQHSGPGAAQASATLIPAILGLLEDAGMALGSLDAIVFGRGPGSFTGLRTACAVAQGLARGAGRGAGIPVLPVDTLMAVAEEARWARLASSAVASPAGDPLRITALLDARMDEMYLQRYVFQPVGALPAYTALGNCALVRPENLPLEPGLQLLAGNVFGVYAGRLPASLAEMTCAPALPTATALLRLAPAQLAAGLAVEAAGALPLYVRDKVAFTTDERARAKAALLAAPPADAVALR